MPIPVHDLPIILLDRIGAAHPAPAYFGADEVEEWPENALFLLLSQGVLADAERAGAITCPGCERQCHSHVEVRRAGRESRAFIMCNEEPQHGRVPVPISSLQRFKTDLRALSLFVAKTLSLGSPKVSRNIAAYALGSVNGRNGARLIRLAVENGEAVLDVGRQHEPMGRVLNWGAAGLGVDRKAIQRLADRKDRLMREDRKYAPDRSQQKARASQTLQRDRALFLEAKKRRARGNMTWTAVAGDLAANNLSQGLEVSSVRRILSKMRRDERKNSRSER